MSAPNKNFPFFLKIFSLFAALVIIIGYSFFQAKNLIDGPLVEISYPSNGASLHDSLVEIQGKAENIVKISLNDRPIHIDQQGVFKEKILLSSGYNIIKVDASDKFGRNTDKILEVVYQ